MDDLLNELIEIVKSHTPGRPDENGAVNATVEAILQAYNRSMSGPNSGDVNNGGHRLCPFCGGTPTLFMPDYDGPAQYWETIVQCSECDAKADGVLREHGDWHEYAIAEAWYKWNRRAVNDDTILTGRADQYIAGLDVEFNNYDLAKRAWKAILSVYGEQPVGWTQPSQLNLVQEKGGKSGEFWPERDMQAVRALLEDTTSEIPDDVPLYAAPKFKGERGINVKLIEWTVEDHGDEQTHLGRTILGNYAVWTKGTNAYVIIPGENTRRQIEGSLEAGFALAQKDFETRIRSVIELN